MQSADAGTEDVVQLVGPPSPMTLFCECCPSLSHVPFSRKFQNRILERIKVLGPPWHPSPLTQPQPRPQPRPQPQPRSQQLPPIIITHRHHHGFESRQSSSSLQSSSSIHCILPLYSLASAVANPFAHLPKAHGLIMCRSSTLFSTWLIIAFCWTSRSSAKQGS